MNNKNPFVFNNLNSYFDGLAKYSNNGFYSKDTIGIQSGYEKPEPDFNNISTPNGIFAIKKDEEGQDYYLFRKVKSNSYFLENKFTTTLKDDNVEDAYWSRLSTKSVQYGAGVINLFFQEVEKAKNDPNFAKTEDKSFFAKAIDTVKNLSGQAISSVGDFFSNLAGTNQNFQPAGQISLSQPGTVQSTGQALTDETQKTEPLETPTQTPTQTPSQIQKPDSSKNIQQKQTIEEDEENQSTVQKLKVQEKAQTPTSTVPQIPQRGNGFQRM